MDSILLLPRTKIELPIIALSFFGSRMTVVVSIRATGEIGD